jgi:methylenetetrahydrofolate reductase (NADPH)
MISYQACNAAGEKFQNVENGDVNAVTWGVFRNKEVIQPTVVDHQAFQIWKEEAFNIWLNTLMPIYEKDSESAKYIQNFHDTHFLINVVHNDYIQGDLNNILLQFIA